MIILVLNGPNLGSLGKREPHIYGHTSLDELNEMMAKKASELGVTLIFFQTNHEGTLIDLLEEHKEDTDALIINPGGLAHTSICLMDAIKAYGKPSVEVHLTDISKREEFRHKSYTSLVATKTFMGQGVMSYIEALEYLIKNHS